MQKPGDPYKRLNYIMKPPAFGPEPDQGMIYFLYIIQYIISWNILMDRASCRSWTVARPAMGEDPPRRPTERCGNYPAGAGSPTLSPLVPVLGRPAVTVSVAMASGRDIRTHGNPILPGGQPIRAWKSQPMASPTAFPILSRKPTWGHGPGAAAVSSSTDNR